MKDFQRKEPHDPGTEAGVRGEGGGGDQTEGRRGVPLVLLFLQVCLHKIEHHS